jgi:acetyl-CoA acetyltransferase family protein
MADDVVLVDGVRTPIGRHGGALAAVRPDDLAAATITALLERTDLDPGRLDDVIFGCTNQAGEDNRNVARMALLAAGLPVSVPGQTVNRLCGSGMQAVLSAAQAIRAGEGDLFIAGGVESMSRAPWVTLKPDRGYPRGAPETADTVLGWRFANPAFPEDWTVGLGETAERVAEAYGVSREAQDAFAVESQVRYANALGATRFRDELVPVTVPSRKGAAVTVDTDEHPRPGTDLDALARLRPVFRTDGSGTVTAGNASGINDGAAALLVARASTAAQLGLKPRAVLIGGAVAGLAPDRMGMGPVPATRNAFDRYGWSAADIDVAEINEAFAAQAIPCIDQLELDPALVNPNGGAIALGHPVGASGARILVTLLHEMGRRRYAGRDGKAGPATVRGLATMCIGVGQGIASLVETV